MNCNNCNNCDNKNIDTKYGCRKCGNKGMNVEFDTVFKLSNEYLRHTLSVDEQFYLCTNPCCNVAYYTLEGRIIETDNVNVDIWYKKNRTKFIVCYCRDISLDDVVLAVDKLTDINIDTIVHFLQKDDIHTDCIHHNPTGLTCEKLFNNAIEYAKKIKNMKTKL